jgi:hypothetical protein
MVIADGNARQASSQGGPTMNRIQLCTRLNRRAVTRSTGILKSRSMLALGVTLALATGLFVLVGAPS